MDTPADTINIWFLFWPVLGVLAYVTYLIAAKKQGKKVNGKSTLLLATGLLIIIVILVWSRAAHG